MNYKQILMSIFLLKTISTLSAADSTTIKAALDSLKAMHKAQIDLTNAAENANTAHAAACLRGSETDKKIAEQTNKIVILRAKWLLTTKETFASFPEEIKKAAQERLKEDAQQPRARFLLL